MPKLATLVLQERRKYGETSFTVQAQPKVTVQQEQVQETEQPELEQIDEQEEEYRIKHGLFVNRKTLEYSV